MGRSEGDKQRVIILGGGLGGLSAAWELSRPGVGHRYEIVVYQQGWRLGGKGASSRNLENRNRIEEHGLHIWLGFYENAFRMLRECYEHVRPPAFPTVWDAFVAASHFVLEEDRPGGWISWDDVFPEKSDRPGDDAALPTLWQQVVLALRLSVHYVQSAGRTEPEVNPEGSLTLKSVPAKGERTTRAVESSNVKKGRQLGAAVFALPGQLLEHPLASLSAVAGDTALAAAAALAILMPEDVSLHSAEHHGFLTRAVERAADWARDAFRPIVEGADSRRRDWYLVDLLLACVRGILHDGVLHKGFAEIDDIDFREWIYRHGAERETVECSLVRTVTYDLQFAYENGDPSQPRCSAATALQGLFRLFFTYRGAIAWKMRAGMGDVVFAPLYNALHDRGVKFKFFHQVKALHLSEATGSATPRLKSIEMLVQADPAAAVGRVVAGGGIVVAGRPVAASAATAANAHPVIGHDGEYLPLEAIETANRSLDCWPHTPRFPLPAGVTPESLESHWCDVGTAHTVTLDHHDQVILAIPVGAQRGDLCQELRDDQPDRWGAMLDNLGAIWTQSVQLWLTKSPEEMGWPWGNGSLGGYVEPFDTIADMSQLLELEDRAESKIKSVAYLCNALQTPDWRQRAAYKAAAAGATDRVRRIAANYLREQAGPIWPLAIRRYPSDFRWELLYDPKKGKGEARLDAQFVRANSDPSECYVLPLPGTGRYRIRPGDSGYDNLKLAGDWTDCVLNAGCVEAAVMSGMLAAQAISGSPRDDQIVGYHQR